MQGGAALASSAPSLCAGGKSQSQLPTWEAEIGLQGDGYNISEHVPGNVCVFVLWIRFLNFAMNIVGLRANTDGCVAEDTACLLESSICRRGTDS